MSNERLHLKNLFDTNTRVTTLRELEKQGKSRVKVVNTSQIIELISQAVERVVERRAISMAEQERSNIIRESNDEFRKLLRDREDERRRNNVNEELVDNYQREAEEAKRQLEEVRLRQDAENGRKVDEEEIRQMIRELEESRENVENLRRQVAEANHDLETAREKARCLEESQLRDGEDYRRVVRELEETRTETESIRRRASDHEASTEEANELRGQVVELEARLRAATTEASHRTDATEKRLSGELENTRSQIEEEKAVSRDLKQKVAEETNRADQLLQQVHKLEAELELSQDLKTKLNASDASLQSKTEELSRAKIELLSLQKEVANHKASAENAAASIEKRTHEFEDISSSHKELIKKYEKRIDGYEERIGTYERRIERLAQEVNESRNREDHSKGAFTSMVTELQGLKETIAENQTAGPTAEAVAEQAAMNQKLQDLFSKKMEAIESSLSQKLSSLATGGNAEVMEPDLVLDRLFADSSNLESNLDGLELKESTSGTIADSLARLKSLQSGSLKGDAGDSSSEGGSTEGES